MIICIEQGYNSHPFIQVQCVSPFFFYSLVRSMYKLKSTGDKTTDLSGIATDYIRIFLVLFCIHMALF